nr:MAG TPA: hypothetical protein [Caudoviricetes sp.]DAX27530.1 MAG TPA: hypothetical protein [Caudoviricetes sp.]
MNLVFCRRQYIKRNKEIKFILIYIIEIYQNLNFYLYFINYLINS